MDKVLRNSLVVIGVLVVGASLVLIGMTISRFNLAFPWGWHALASPEFNSETSQAFPYPYGGMMRFITPEGGEIVPFSSAGPDLMNGFGMMSGYGYGMMGSTGMMGGVGMMGGFSSNSLLGIDPISQADAEIAIQEYLDVLQDDNLAIGEIMIFDNHAYTQIVEVDTGIGAVEVLVDPVTLAVSPEPGPNMMWNLKYSPMSGFGGFGMMGMMGRTTAEDISAVMPLQAEEAVEVAQRYLDAFVPGTVADEHADPFYGYYTIHILREGNTVGMLSVNGYTSQVFVHTWHGDLISMSDHEED